MRRVSSSIAIVLGLLAIGCPLATAQTVEPLAAQLAPPLPAPLLAGDWPDPDLTLVDGAYYMVATSGGFAPTFPVLRSTDLRAWESVGAVFPRAPAWTRDSFWAPELAELPAGGVAVFYSAMPRRAWRTRADGVTVLARGAPRRPAARKRGAATPPARPWYCLGVATAPSPAGPWRDLGRPLRCTPHGTIDATPVVDGRRLHLVYKEDANAFARPTPILIQRLRADGRRLLGAPRELLRNRPRSWEGKVVEAPFLVRRGGFWHMLYSGGLCCSPRCTYAVGSARARTLAGPWRRNPANPILRSGGGWRCPGHVSVAGDAVAFHAYRDGGFLAGRQPLVASLAFRGGWPTIGSGRPAAPSGAASAADFDDRFPGPALDAGWEWPVTHPPGVRLGDGGLTLRAPVRSSGSPPPRVLAGRVDAGLVARRLGNERFSATAVVDLASLSGDELAGIAVYRTGPFAIGGQAIGIALRASPAGEEGFAAIDVWRRGARPTRRANRIPLAGRHVHLRIVAAGRRHRFLASADGVAWQPVGPAWRSPVEETARIALTVGGQRAATARFARATLAASP